MRIRMAAAALLAILSVMTLAPGGDARPSAEPAASLTSLGATFDGFNTISPERLLDTRVGIGAPAAPVGDRQVLTVPIAGRGSIPADASSVLMNVTVDAPTRGGYVTVFPAGEAVPSTSNVNMPPDKTVPNLVAIRLGAGGEIRLDLSDRFPAVIDIGGVVLNVTAVAPTERSFITVYPADTTLPNASNLNLVPGENVPNAAVVRPDSGGVVIIRNERGATHVVVDLVGLIPRVTTGDPGPSNTTTIAPAASTSTGTPTTTAPTSSTAVTTTTTAATTSTTSTTTSASTSSSSSSSTTTGPPNADGRCVVGAPGAGGSTDLETGFAPGYGYDLDPTRYATRTMPDGPELIDLQAAAIGCDLVIVHGFSEGGRRAKEWYCGGESLGGRVVGYVIDDPNYLPDEGLPCTPAPGMRVALYGTRMSATDHRWTVDFFLEATGYGAVMDKTAARLGTAIIVSPRYFHEPYTRPSPPEIANSPGTGGWW